MKKAKRTQVDDLGDLASAATGLSFPDDEPGARQEFRDETDINLVLKRYGLPQAPQPVYGESDDTLDLQSALRVQQEAADAFRRLDPTVQAKWGNWRRLYEAASRGELNANRDPSPHATAPESE